MNTVVRAAVRLSLDRGYNVLAVRNGFRGLLTATPRGGVDERQGTCRLSRVSFGTNRYVPDRAVAQTLR